VALHRVELLQVAAHHRVLVGVDHHHRALAAHQRGHGPGLGRAQQQVVAVDVQTVHGHPALPLGAVGVGTRQHRDVDPVEQGRQVAGRQSAGDQQHGFGAGRFVAVLLAQQQHPRPAGAARKMQSFQRHAVLRPAGRQALHPRARRRRASDAGQSCRQIVIGGEGLGARRQRRQVVVMGWRREALGHGRAIGLAWQGSGGGGGRGSRHRGLR